MLHLHCPKVQGQAIKSDRFNRLKIIAVKRYICWKFTSSGILTTSCCGNAMQHDLFRVRSVKQNSCLA